jgi:hypothetical protein
MNPLRANFAELYQRHLCRHSQFGINVIHLLSLVGSYWCLYSFAYSLIGNVWPLVGVAALYLGIVAFNVPFRLFAMTVVFAGILLGLVFTVPALPMWACWAYLLPLYPLYKLQIWSHRLYDKAYDMTEFNKKYPKGFKLFVLLTTYEVPIQLNYLLLQGTAGMTAASTPPEGSSMGVSAAEKQLVG